MSLPFSKQDVKERDGQICEIVTVDLADLIGFDHEAIMDIFSEEILGNVMLQEISYETKGVTEDGMILIEVSGYVDENDMEDMI